MGHLRLFTRVSDLGTESDQLASLSLYSRWPCDTSKAKSPFSQDCEPLQQVSKRLLPRLSLRDCCGSSCWPREEPGDTSSRGGSFNIVVDADHILVAVKSLDEVSSLLQLRSSQLHL